MSRQGRGTAPSDTAQAVADLPGTGSPPLVRLLAQVERALSRSVAATLTSTGLTVDQWRVLDVLAADDTGHSMTEIAALVVVPGPTLTKIVDRLVESALVYRLVDSQDRRRVLAYCSEQGHQLHGRLAPLVARSEAEATAHLGEQDAATFRSLVTRLAAR